MTLYYITTANDDWTQLLGSPTKIHGGSFTFAENNKVIYPNFISYAYGDIDTSAIGTDVISAVVFYLDEAGYTASKRLPKTYRIQMFRNSISTWVTLTNGSSITYSGGTINISLTASEISHIQSSGKTSFRAQVTGTVSAGKYKQLKINAFETSQATAMRLDVTHAPASVSKKKVLLRLTDRKRLRKWM